MRIGVRSGENHRPSCDPDPLIADIAANAPPHSRVISRICLIIGCGRLSGSYGKGRSVQDGSLVRYNLIDIKYTVAIQ